MMWKLVKVWLGLETNTTWLGESMVWCEMGTLNFHCGLGLSCLKETNVKTGRERQSLMENALISSPCGSIKWLSNFLLCFRLTRVIITTAGRQLCYLT